MKELPPEVQFADPCDKYVTELAMHSIPDLTDGMLLDILQKRVALAVEVHDDLDHIKLEFMDETLMQKD